MNEVRDVECVNSKFGTADTQLSWYKKNGEKIEVVKRSDIDSSYYLVFNRNLKKYFVNIENLLISINDKKMLKYRLKSNLYLKKLGYFDPDILEMLSNDFTLNHKSLCLSKSEFQIMKITIIFMILEIYPILI